MAINRSTPCITLPTIFSNISPKDELIQEVFLNIVRYCKNYKWLSECVILAATDNNVKTINSSLQNGLHDEAAMHEFFNTVMNQDIVVN